MCNVCTKLHSHNAVDKNQRTEVDLYTSQSTVAGTRGLLHCATLVLLMCSLKICIRPYFNVYLLQT
jgi:hypothetical protein